MLKNELTLGSLNELRRPKVKDFIRKINIAIFVLGIVMALNTMGIISVLYAMIAKVSTDSIYDMFSTGDTLLAIRTTSLSIILSISLIGIIGIPVAYLLSTREGTLYNIIEAITFIPLILPPSVAGLALLMAFGKNGVIGSWLFQKGIQLPFTFWGIVIVQVFVCLPFFIQIVKNTFDDIEISVIEAAKVFGAGEWQLLFHFYVPISMRAILSGVVLCSLRAAGEFGATIMFAGNLVGKTQTITTRIYSLYQYDMMGAVTLAVLQLLILIIPTLLLRFYFKR